MLTPPCPSLAPSLITISVVALVLCAQIVEGVTKNIPAGRFGKPEEVAGLVK